MSQQQWTAVDRYLVDQLVPSDPALDEALRSTDVAGLPAIEVSPLLGKLLHLLARIQGAKRILELGTLGGYSTIWLARALPAGGKLITLEADPKHAKVAAANIARADQAAKVEIRLGPALETLPKLLQEDPTPFDMIFIDADKPNNPVYLEWALRLSRPGTILIFDNVVRDGAVIDSSDPDPTVRGTRTLHERLASNPRLDATALQTVGSKGYDGFALAIVR